MTNFIDTWKEFLNVFANHILPVYEEHENKFDFFSVHGRIHVSRALIFAEVMSRFYSDNYGTDIDFDAVRYAISFHDSGRQANGPDRWESDSADKCYDFLKEKDFLGKDSGYGSYVGSLIEKHGNWDAHKKIVHDADVLEIMRPTCGHGGIDGFRRNALRFLGHKDGVVRYDPNNEHVRELLISEAWKLIVMAENKKSRLTNNSDYFNNILEIIGNNRDDFSMLSDILK